LRPFSGILLAALLISSGAPLAHAQFFDTQAISIGILPEFPEPYDTVTVTPRSTQIDLVSSEVTITANGAVIEKGSGSRSATVRLGGPGSSTTIRVTAVYGGTTYASEVTLRPADVSLAVEPQTTTHPLYEGGVLVAPEGKVRLVALSDFRNASGTRIPASALSYTWRVGNKILTEESGLGRSVLLANAPVRYRNAIVSVTVTNADSSMVGFASTEIAPASPKLYAYASDPLLGIDLAHAITGTFMLRSQEETFEAVPFSFGSTPSFSWTLGGEPAGSDRALTVRSDGASAGSVIIGVSATDVRRERAATTFDVSFGTASKNLFGF